MNLDEALQLFIVECRELLEEMEAGLLAVETAQEKSEIINAVFRAAHTIKGSSGLFSLDHIVAFTHVVESVLDRVRSGKQALDGQLVALLLGCGDHIRALVDGVASGEQSGTPSLTQAGEPLVLGLRGYLDAPAAAPSPKEPSRTSETGSVHRIEGTPVDADHWHISVRFGPDVLRNGMDPMSFIRYLATLGQITAIATVADSLPDVTTMDPETCYLGFEIAFKGNPDKGHVDKAAIEQVFEFVREESQLFILPPHSLVSAYVQLLERQRDSVRLGEMLMRCGSLTAQELDSALNQQTEKPNALIGTIFVTQGSVQPEVVEAALQKQKHAKETVVAESRSIRVDADKLDQLINLVGELIIAGANVNMIAHRAKVVELEESTSKLSTLVEEVRDSALQLRMVKIGATFNRFQRVVHDVSRELGKDIALVIDGEETELDKTVVEKIGDPLMHLIRNCMDHGIESAEVRRANGKSEQGTVRLNAFHDSGSIVITVEDDGGGLKRDRILAKAIERGLVEPGHSLSDAEVYGLVLEPGFSTADKVSNLSGRGVGMDVVKRNIAALRGTVSMNSEEGRGTTVTVRLPLTLAIIDGFLVGVEKAVYAIPLDMIEECVAFSAEPGHDYTNLRGEVLPFIRLRQLFGMRGETCKDENIVVLKHGNQRAGLVVDTLLGEFQTVIKPLGKMFSQVKCVSGSTILGSGDVALILDVPSLVQQAMASAEASVATAGRRSKEMALPAA